MADTMDTGDNTRQPGQIDRFMFDLWLDGSAPGRPGPGDGGDEAEDGEDPAFSEAELDAARAEGYAEGLAAGEAQVQASLERQATLTLAGIEAHLGALVQEAAAAREASLENVVVVANAIGAKIAGLALEQRETELVVQIAEQCLARLFGEDKVVIRIKDELVSLLGDRLRDTADKAGFKGEVEIVGAADLEPTDCRIEWQSGVAERTGRLVADSVAETIDRVLAEIDPAPADTDRPEAGETQGDDPDAGQGSELTPTAPPEGPSSSDGEDHV